jgi:dinuclear metal center YbgI/SA1388 family protein
MPEELTIADVADFLEAFAPLQLAEEWDNVGLLVGDRRSPARRVMTCLTLTQDVAVEAVERQADLVVTHHPLLFRPVQRLTADTVEGETLLKLIRGGVAVYSPHTAFDSALEGINQQLAEGLGLEEIAPLRPTVGIDSEEGSVAAGGARYGRLSEPTLMQEFLTRVRRLLGAGQLQFVGDPGAQVRMVAVACGSAAEFLRDAGRAGCDVLVTGEARFHACLEARDSGIALALAGHYATERPAVEELSRRLAAEFEGLDAWASRVESDPVQWLNGAGGEHD